MPEGEESKESYPGTIQTAEVLVLNKKGDKILLAKYLEGPKEGKVGIIGGRMKLTGESLPEVAARELAEEVEIGLDKEEIEERLRSFDGNYFTMNEFPMKDGTFRHAATTAYYLEGGIAEGFGVESLEPEKLEAVWMSLDDVANLPEDMKMPNTDIAIQNCPKPVKSHE